MILILSDSTTHLHFQECSIVTSQIGLNTGFYPGTKLRLTLDFKCLQDPRPYHFMIPIDRVICNSEQQIIIEHESIVVFPVIDQCRITMYGGSMQSFDPYGYQQKISDHLEYELHIKHVAAFKIQRFYKMHFLRRMKAARIIQKNVGNWIDKPITKDGKIGIACRIIEQYVRGL